MSRLRLGFPLLVAILLLLTLTLAPNLSNLLWPGAVELDRTASVRSSRPLDLEGSNRANRATETQVVTPLAPVSPLPNTAMQSPLAVPDSGALYPPTGYIEADLNHDARRLRVSFHFDRPMDKTSIAWALRTSPPVATLRTWEGNTLIVEPSKPLSANEQFTLILTTEALDSNGIPLATELRYDWWVPPLYANVTPPAVNNLGEAVIINFSYEMYGESVLEALRIEPAIPGKIEWDLKNKQVVLYPDPPLMANRLYSFSFAEELLDVHGQRIAPPPEISFLTPPLFVPADHGGPIHPGLPLRLHFDRAMDATTTGAALTISPSITVAQGWVGNTLILTPTSGSFGGNSAYSIGLQPTATSADGDFVLSDPYYHRVAFAQATPLGDFGYGPNLQVLLAEGARKLQYQTVNSEIAHDFALYALTPDQFLTRYVDDFALMEGSLLPLISVEGAEKVATWQEVGERVAAEYAGNQIHRETTLPDALPPGLYLLELKIGGIYSQIFVVLTDQNVVTKRGAHEVVAWLSDSDGAPTVGAEVTLFARDGSVITTTLSDAEGLLSVPLDSVPLDSVPLDDEDAPLLLFAEVDDQGAEGVEIALAGFDPAWTSRVSTWGWGWPPPRPPATRAHAVHLYTERPIYQPGQTVFYKAIIRSDADARLTLPAQDVAVQVRLRDARNNLVRTMTHTPNAFGTISGKFDIAEGAMVGQYQLELEINGEISRRLFQMQAYRKPDFTVKVSTDSPVYTPQQAITFHTQSNFLWGEPVANASVRWQRFYKPPQVEGQGMAPITMFGDSGISSLTGEDGSVSITLPASDFDTAEQRFPPGGTWGMEVTVEDAVHQSVSASTALQIVDSAQQLHVSVPEFQLVNEPFTVAISVTDISGASVAGKRFEISMAREDPSGTGPLPSTGQTTITTRADGPTQVKLTMGEVGLHYLYVNELNVNELYGNELVLNAEGLNAEGEQSEGAGTNEERLLSTVAQVSIVDLLNASEHTTTPYYPFVVSLDRTTYLPGEQATIMILSRFGGPALLTMERGEVYDRQVIELTPPKTLVTTTITAADAPNILVSVSGWEAMAAIAPLPAQRLNGAYATDLSYPDMFLHSSKAELHVAMPDKRLLVTLDADEDQYAPRQSATFTITVRDQSGRPVAAELSLALVDEAIFTLANVQEGSLFDAFYFPRAHTVRSFDSMAPTRYLADGRGGGGGGGSDSTSPRHDFRDTVAWLPDVQTNADGVATVTVTLPDNLTTWRLTVKAISAESTQVGETVTTISTWQPLVVRPMLPRGLTAGDNAMLSATLHNESDVTQAATVWLQATSAQLQIGTMPTQTVSLAPGEVRMVGWPVTATAAGSVPVTIGVQQAAIGNVAGEDVALPAGALADAVVSALVIHPLAIAERVTQVGQFDETWQTMVNVPVDVLPTGELHIELNRSVAGSFVSGLEYLTGFPYGCVEQTMSRALPNAVVSRAFHRLGLDTSRLHPDLPGLVDASVQRLYGFQHDDGGWGWWYDDLSHDYQTAWVIYGLAITAQGTEAQSTEDPNIYQVDNTVIERGVRWLGQHLDTMDARTSAFALYSMALADPIVSAASVRDRGEIHASVAPAEVVRSAGVALLENLAELDAFSLAALALALDSVGADESTQVVMDALLAGITADEDHAFWSLAQSDGYYEQKTMASSTRSTALALSALLQIDSDNVYIPDVARWLMNQRQSSGWGSTNETSFALVALTDYLLATAQPEGTSNFVIEINGEEVTSGTLSIENTRENTRGSVVIPVAQLSTGDNEVRLRQVGDGPFHSPVYYKVSADFAVGQSTLDAAGNITLDRHYEDAQTGEVLATVQAGQVVRVVLNVGMPTMGFYMLIEDSVPGGLEPLNESLNTTSFSAMMENNSMHNAEYGYNQKEIYGDRVRFFITELAEGSHRFSYLARATHAGNFVALPTEASAMYNMQLWGRSASQEVAVIETTDP